MHSCFTLQSKYLSICYRDNPIGGLKMAKKQTLHDYRSATDILFAKVRSDDLAAALDLPKWVIDRTRQESGTRFFRAPPANWHQGVIDAAEAQIEVLQQLVKDVRHSQAVERMRVLRPELSAKEAEQLLRDNPALHEVVQPTEGKKP